MTEQLIRTNSKDVSSVFHTSNIEAFPYKYEGFGKLPINDINYVFFDPDTTSTETKSRFIITLEHSMIGETVLEWDQAALTVTGGTFRRFPDWFPYEAIDRLELRYQAKKIQVIPGFRFFLRNHIILDEKELERDALDAYGFKSTIERNALRDTIQHVRIKLPFYYTLAPANYLPLFLLEKNPVIEIFWKDLTEYIQTDGTAPISARSNIKLRIETLYLTMDKKKYIQAQVSSTNGLTYYVRDFIPLEDRMATTASSVPFQIPLEPLNHEIAYIAAYIRRRNEVDGGMALFRGHENLLPWTDYSLKSGAKFLRDVIAYDESIYRDNFKFLGHPGTNILMVYTSENVTDENNCYGSKPIGLINTPSLQITFDPSNLPLVNDNLRVDLYGAFHNLINMRYENTGNGEMSLIWEAIFI